MFDSLFPKHWTTLQRLMWLKTNALARAVYETITGNPVSFTAKAAPLRKLKVAFSPVQSLNGYDSPWPAGGGANKWDEEWENGYINNLGGLAPDGSSIRSKNFNACLPTESYYYVKPSTYAITPNLVWYDENKNFIRRTDPNTEFPVATAPSNAFFFKITAYGYGTTYNHDIAINYPSSVTTYSPYSNICPISGWSSLTVEQTGVNVWDEEWELGGLDGTTGQTYSSTSRIVSKNYIPVAPNTSYYLLAPKAFSFAWYDASKTHISGQNSASANYERTSPNGARYLKFSIQGTTYDHDISVNYPATDHDYHAYNPSSRSISISLGETVYSGTLDIVTGVLTVDMGMADLGSLSYNKEQVTSGTYGRFYTTELAYVIKKQEGTLNLICTSYRPYSTLADTMNSTDGIWLSSAGNLSITSAGYENTTSADFKTAMSGVQLVYELATPIPIQLAPQEVESLLGENNMWSDANQPITVEYRKN